MWKLPSENIAILFMKMESVLDPQGNINFSNHVLNAWNNFSELVTPSHFSLLIVKSSRTCRVVSGGSSTTQVSFI